MEWITSEREEESKLKRTLLLLIAISCFLRVISPTVVSPVVQDHLDCQGMTVMQCIQSEGWTSITRWDMSDFEEMSRLSDRATWRSSSKCRSARRWTRRVLGNQPGIMMGWGRNSSNSGEHFKLPIGGDLWIEVIMINERFDDWTKLLTVIHEASHSFGLDEPGAQEMERCVIQGIDW